MILDIRLIQRVFAMKITKIFYRRNGLKAIKSSESNVSCDLNQVVIYSKVHSTNEKDKGGH